MTIKTLLFALFLYVCLAWVGAAYLKPEDTWRYGLLWTAIGLILVLVFIVTARIFGWWRLWRARAAARPPEARPAAVANEEDAAMAALLAEANAAAAPAFPGKRIPLAGMPLYLLVGPEGSGKTGTFINSGLEPQLLAGQVAGTAPIIPTRLCNIWLANDAIFVEISGHVFSGDLSHWTQLLRALRGQSTAPLWKRMWSGPEQGFVLHGVVTFCNAKAFTGSQNPEGLERRSRELQERLAAIGEVFGTEFPVYQIITNCDSIQFFGDFFRRLPEPEANQVLGCTMPLEPAGTRPTPPDERAKALTRSFRPFYQELARERVRRLTHEPDRSKRPAVYEFPRELKRIRTPLVQYLNDTFRPNPLRPGPRLRGYYLTGTREVEGLVANIANETQMDWSLIKGGGGGDATRIFRSGETSVLLKPGARSPLVSKWIFVADLFRNVILADRPVRAPVAVDARIELYRRIVLAGACGLCLVLCTGFLWSWTANRALLHDVERASEAAYHPSDGTTLTALRTLDGFREQVQNLIDWDRSSRPWGVRWFLYSGNSVLDEARTAYFRRFQALLLNPLSGDMVATLKGVPLPPTENAPSEPVYNLLKAYRMISSEACKVEPAFAGQSLRATRQKIGLAPKEDEAGLADQQIDFYSRELLPLKFWVSENAEASDHARQYLQSLHGTDAIYNQLKADAEKVGKMQRLAELAPNYKTVLTGPAEPSAAFTAAGWQYVLANAKDGIKVSDDCVMGNSGVSQIKQGVTVARELQSRYIREYIDQWRKYVEGFSVIHYNGPADAAHKLDILSDHHSPLLGVLKLTSGQTNFVGTPQASSGIEKIPLVNRMFSNGKKAEKAIENVAGDQLKAGDVTAITDAFQPAHFVVPAGGDVWIGGNNAAYMKALGDLSRSMQAIATNPSDPPAQQAAGQAYDGAMAAAKGLENGFAVGQGVDTAVQNLLEQPIKLTSRFINRNPGGPIIDKVNGEAQTLCTKLHSPLQKYPFRRTSSDDVSLEELARFFSPTGGLIWKFQTGSLADFTVKDASHQWKPKDPSQKPQVTQEMLAFLNKAQGITDAFYPGGASQPQLSYTLRPKLDSSWNGSVLELQVDGQNHTWTTSLQSQFNWPAPAGTKDPSATAIMHIGNSAFGFASRRGLWGIFRVMGDAEERQMGSKLVEWKYTTGGTGLPVAIQPAPVRLEIVEFPGGVDVFNSKFFTGLQCTAKALQP